MHTQFELIEATIPQLQSALSTGIVTSHDLVTQYLARIEAYDQHGPALNAISVMNSKALAEADAGWFRLPMEWRGSAPDRLERAARNLDEQAVKTALAYDTLIRAARRKVEN